MILHNWPINMFTFAFNFFGKEESEAKNVVAAGQADPASPWPGGAPPVWPRPPSRGRAVPGRPPGPCLSVCLHPERGAGGALAETRPPWPPRDAGFRSAGGELGALERTRVLHPFRGAENPPAGLQRGARPRQEEAGARRTF